MLTRRSLFAVAIAILALFLPLTNAAGGARLGTVEKSWKQTFVVHPIDSIAMRGVLGLPKTEVNGSFTVRSCCGYSTNDIRFNIENVDFSAFKDFGVVVYSLNFTWDTGTSEEYEMHFDNGWGQICDQNGCHPDPSNPSSHNKTIELSVREVAPGTFSSLLTETNVIIGVAMVVGAGSILSAFVILTVGRRRSSGPEPRSYSRLEQRFSR